ncbi:Serine/threonine-protein kinase toxin HipA [compost metagenome]
MAISNSLPLAAGAFPAEQGLAHNWFANLLPEEGARQALLRRLGVADEDFALLAAIGGDCAGALSLLADGQAPQAEAGRQPVARDELARWAEGRERFALFEPGRQGATRLSLAGAQDKVPLLLDGEALFLPQGSTPSSHLVKFGATPALVLNELYLNRLAMAVGLPVPDSRVGRAGKALYLLVRRYDRVEDEAEGLQRLHQEDFCQALGLPRRLKYQEDGGPSLGECAALLRRVTRNPALQVLQLLRWQLFNVLTGNCDGHAKNLSLLQDARGDWSLAPAYDLLCTLVLPYSPNLGFAVGGNYHPQELRREDWELFARDMGLSAPFVRRELGEMAERLGTLAQSEPLREAMLQAGMQASEWAKVQHVRKLVVQQCKRARLWL